MNLVKALNFLGYVTLEKRRGSHVCNLVKKCLSNRCPQFFMNYFNYNRDILPRKTRSSDKLRLPTVRLECTKKAFFYHGCVIFNQNFLVYLSFYSLVCLYLIVIVTFYNLVYFIGPLRISVFPVSCLKLKELPY